MSEQTTDTRKRVTFVILATLISIGFVSYLSLQPHHNVAHALTKPDQELAQAPAPGDTIMKQAGPQLFLDPVPVGQKAPDFTVKDATGKTVSLSGFKGEKNVVLIFYQGDFCKVCGNQLDQFQSEFKAFQDQDTEILAISADKPASARKTHGEHGLSFSVIPDTDLKIINLFGVPNVQKNIAWPSVFVVDKKGIVKVSHADPKYTRLYPKDLLPVLGKLK